MIDKPSNKIPKPSDAAIEKLILGCAPRNSKLVTFMPDDPPAWLRDIIIIAYQSGRYDEASAETFAASFD